MKKVLLLVVSALAFLHGSTQIKVSALPAMSGLCDTCKMPVVQLGVTKKAGGNQIAWGLKGTAGTTAGTHYMGTTDAQAFVIKTNGTERARYLSTGELGIGTATPTSGYKLEVSTSDILVYGIRIGKGAGSVSSNTVVGSGSLNANTSGSNNTVIGNGSLVKGNKSGNTIVGSLACDTIGGNWGTYIGVAAGYMGGGEQAVAVGHNALRNKAGTNGGSTDGVTAVGAYSLYNNLTAAINNTGVGWGAGASITSGTYNTFGGCLSAGAGTFIGGTAGLTGSSNTGYGFGVGFYLTSGSNNSFLGRNAGGALTTGSSNTFIGYNSGSSATTVSNAVIIGGHSGSGVADSEVLLANGAGTERMRITANGYVIIAAVPSFADNAAAITGGLGVGTVYRNGDALQIVH